MSENGIHARTLPFGWELKRLDDVCEFLDFRRKPVKELDRCKRIAGKPHAELYPYYGANGQAGWIDGYLFDEELILLAEDGGAFGSARRPIAYAVRGKYWVNNHAHVLRPRSGVDFDFCLFALSVRPDIGALVTGNTRPKLNQSLAAAIPMPMPPLGEQRRIARMLKQQLDSVERARVAAKTQLDACRALRPAYFRELLNKYGFDQWPEARLGELAASVNNGIYKSAEHYGHGHPFLRMYNVRNDSRELNLDTLARVELNDDERTKFEVRSGDLLFSRVNSLELVGKCALVGPEADGFVFENMLIRVRLIPEANPRFISQLATTNLIREQIRAAAKRAIGQASINSSDLRALRFPLPPPEVQRDVVLAIDAKINATNWITRAAEEQLTYLRDFPAELLRSIFQGRMGTTHNGEEAE